MKNERALAFLEELANETRLWESCIYDANFSSRSDYSLLINQIQNKLDSDYRGLNLGNVIDLCFSSDTNISFLSFQQRMLIAYLYYDNKFFPVSFLDENHVEYVKESLKSGSPNSNQYLNLFSDNPNDPEDKKRYNFALLYGAAYFSGDQDAAFELARLTTNSTALPEGGIQEKFSFSNDGLAILNSLKNQEYVEAIFIVADIKGGLTHYEGLSSNVDEAINLLEHTKNHYRNSPEIITKCSLRLGLIHQKKAESLERSGSPEGKTKKHFAKAQVYLSHHNDSLSLFTRAKNLLHNRVSLEDDSPSTTNNKKRKIGQIHTMNNEVDSQIITLFEQAISANTHKEAVSFSYAALADMILEGRHSQYPNKNPIQAKDYYERSHSYQKLARMYEKGCESFPIDKTRQVTQDISMAAYYYKKYYESIAEKLIIIATVMDESPHSSSCFFASLATPSRSSSSGESPLTLVDPERTEADLENIIARSPNDSTKTLNTKLQLGMKYYNQYLKKNNSPCKGDENTRHRAIDLIYFAAKHNLVSAMVELAKIEYAENRHESAVAWATEAAKHNHPHAHYLLYQFYQGELPNRFLKKDEIKALEHIKAAASAKPTTVISLTKRDPKKDYRFPLTMASIHNSKVSSAQKYDHAFHI